LLEYSEAFNSGDRMAERITKDSFKSYGWVIEFPKDKLKNNGKSLFCVVRKDRKAAGWRIAYLIVRDKSLNKLEQHINTLESFEPVCGKTILYVSEAKVPSKIRRFRLDRPVILKKGIWHGVVTQGRQSEIKITENAVVKSAYWKLGFVLNGCKK